MEQMTGTNGAYIGVTTAHSCAHTRRRMCERAAVVLEPFPLLSVASLGKADVAYPACIPTPATRRLLIRPLLGVHKYTRRTQIPRQRGC